MFQLPLPVAHKEKKVQAQIQKCGDRQLPAVRKTRARHRETFSKTTAQKHNESRVTLASRHQNSSLLALGDSDSDPEVVKSVITKL